MYFLFGYSTAKYFSQFEFGHPSLTMLKATVIICFGKCVGYVCWTIFIILVISKQGFKKKKNWKYIGNKTSN